MSDYIKREDAIEAVKYWDWHGITDVNTEDLVNSIDCVQAADVPDYATAHKIVRGGERDGSTCWFECDNCGLSVDIGDLFCKHCGARFVP